MEEINLDALSNEITNTEYYKRLQKSLREKHLNAVHSKDKSTKTTTAATEKSKTTSTQPNSKLDKKPSLDDLHFKDEVILSKKEEKQDANQKLKQKEITSDIQKEEQKFKYNAKDILRSLGYKIDFHSKKEEFKEMFKFNYQESKSHNLFASRFARFKVGIVNQILTSIGVSYSELNQLKMECEKEFIEQNQLEMSENIYNIELNEIVNGKGKKSRHYTKMFITIQSQLINQMKNLGKTSYWSKTKLYEEKIKQCEKIKQEFTEEMQHLEYLLRYIKQKKVKNG